jgi:hypothetical protein
LPIGDRRVDVALLPLLRSARHQDKCSRMVGPIPPASSMLSEPRPADEGRTRSCGVRSCRPRWVTVSFRLAGVSESDMDPGYVIGTSHVGVCSRSLFCGPCSYMSRHLTALPAHIGFVLPICVFILKPQGMPSFAIQAPEPPPFS